MNKADAPEAEVCLYDEIGGWGVRAKDFIAELKAVNRPIHLRINSPGGDVFDGLAIGNYLASYPHAVRATIDGYAASIASIIAASIKSVTIAANAFVMIHNPWTFAAGDSDELKETAAVLDKIRDSLVTTYAKKCGKARDVISGWMDATTWFDATEAKEAGLVDAIGDAAEIKNAFALERLGDVPERVAKAINGGALASAKPHKDSMTKLMNALAAAGLIATAQATDEEAAKAVQAWLDQNKANLDGLKAKVDAALKVEAEAAVSAKVQDPAKRAPLVALYIENAATAKAVLDAIPAPTPHVPRNGAPPVQPEEKTGKGGSDEPAYKSMPHGPERLKAFLAKFPIKN